MRSRIRYAAITILIASVPIVLMLFATRGGERGMPAEPLWQTLVYGVAQWYPWAILAPFIDRRVRQSRPRTRTDRLRVMGGHAAIAAAFIIVHGTAMHATLRVIEPEVTRPLWRAIRAELIPDTILYIAIGVGFTVAESRRRQTEVAERLRAEVAEARLDALRQQLNPHFLFNTLNHIVSELRSLRSQDVEPALRMLLALSDLLRDVLRERAQLIPLRDEVRIVERYLEIERARFGDRLQAEVTFEPRALDALVPSLFLQPLLENAMRHGVSAVDGRCRLGLTVRTRDDRVLIEVRDAGPGMDPAKTDSTAGVGLRNTSERLRYLYGDDHAFALRPLDGGGLLVAIDLPFRRS
jgi:two-component system, LytTR family, sensor kinase